MRIVTADTGLPGGRTGPRIPIPVDPSVDPGIPVPIGRTMAASAERRAVLKR